MRNTDENNLIWESYSQSRVITSMKRDLKSRPHDADANDDDLNEDSEDSEEKPEEKPEENKKEKKEEKKESSPRDLHLSGETPRGGKGFPSFSRRR